MSVNEASRSVTTAAVATVLAAAAFVNTALLAGVLFAIVAAIAMGWPWLVALPAPSGSTFVIGLSGVASVLAVALAPGEPLLRWLTPALGLSVVAAFAYQLVRRDGRPRLVEAVAGIIGGMLVLASAAGWIAAVRTSGGVTLVVGAAVAIAAASAAASLPLRGLLGAAASLFAGSLAGGGVAMLMPFVSGRAGLLIGLTAGVLVSTLQALFAHLPAAGQRPAVLASVTLPVAASGIAVYVAGRVLIG